MAKIGLRRIALDLPTANVAVQISSTSILVSWFRMHQLTAGTGPVYIGNSAVNTSWIPYPKAVSYLFEASQGGDQTEGDTFDLSKLYVVSATAGDDVVIEYPVFEA